MRQWMKTALLAALVSALAVLAVPELSERQQEGIRIPVSCAEQKGRDADAVYQELTELGFTNVSLEKVKNDSGDYQFNTVYEITLNGRPYDTVSRYPADSIIWIYYHPVHTTP